MEFNGKALLKDLEWRGLLGATSGPIEEMLNAQTTFYVGTDPTSIPDDALNPNHPEITTSLHVGHMLAIVTAKRLQLWGHKPIILIGQTTAAIGDAAGRTTERELIPFERISQNAECLKKQISRLMDFESDTPNKAIMVNNYDWMSNLSLVEFARTYGKIIPVNFMLAKESIKMRLENGHLSLCEMLYSPLQGVDFYHLYKTYGCTTQIGGMDQIGSMTYGSMLIRKLLGHDKETCTLNWPLITKADGSKFGKSLGGCVWLDPNLTTPYQFYQFWLNVADDDAKRFIKMFTLLSREEIESLIEEHEKAPHMRVLQKALAKEVTVMVHSEKDYEIAVEASEVLFGKSTEETLRKLDDKTILSVFDGVPTFEVEKTWFDEGIKLSELSVERTSTFKSKGDLRKLIANGGVSINKSKINEDVFLTSSNLLNNKFLLVQQGKKNYTLIVAR